MADIGGLTVAYRAWEEKEDSNSSLLLPGLETFTQAQLFFVSFGQATCQKLSFQALDRYLRNSHPPWPVRAKVFRSRRC